MPPIARARFTRLCCLCCAGLAAFAALTACGHREKPLQLSFVYQKQGVSQAQLLDDERELRHTSGVLNVITHLDAKDHVTLELYVNERNKVPGIEKVQELGYQQVRN